MATNLKYYLFICVGIIVLVSVLIVFFAATSPKKVTPSEVTPTVVLPTETKVIIPTAIIPSSNVGEDGLNQ